MSRPPREALNPEVFKQFEQKTGLRIHEAYGQTETTVLMGNFVGAPVEKVGSLGKAGPLYDVDIVGEDGQPLPPGEVGEIVVRTPDGVHPIGMFQKYYEGGGEKRRPDRGRLARRALPHLRHRLEGRGRVFLVCRPD